MKQRVLIWDLPTRVFHWALVLNFAGAYVSAESERWALVHITCGYSLLGLIFFRIVWGFAGSRYARFTGFIPHPKAVKNYFDGLIRRRPAHFVGHNPIGALSIFALILLGLISGISGWLVYSDIGAAWLEKLHEQSAQLMLTIVVLHVLGVLISSRLHRENLIQSMIDGRKWAEHSLSITTKHTLVALVMLVSLVGFWLWTFRDVFRLGG
jgi:cytochrome b